MDNVQSLACLLHSTTLSGSSSCSMTSKKLLFTSDWSDPKTCGLQPLRVFGVAAVLACPQCVSLSVLLQCRAIASKSFWTLAWVN